MTLVLETDIGTDPNSDAAIGDVLSRYGLTQCDAPLVMGEHSFSYYHIATSHEAAAAAEALRLLPGVNAAYLKPEGSPPA